MNKNSQKSNKHLEDGKSQSDKGQNENQRYYRKIALKYNGKRIEDPEVALRDLQAGLIPEDKLYATIHFFGHEEFLKAKPDIEAFLTHEDPQLRDIALNVLIFHWGCEDHRSTCESFAVNDPDSDVRIMGVMGLGSLLRGARDSKALRLLLQIFRNENEEKLIRDSAYGSILKILSCPVSEWGTLPLELDYSKDINWDRIKEAENIVNSSESARK